jgi:phenylpropionate dioxygenase-like ring-hydroxylating dioxygenase large terminal subunit
MNTEAVTPEKLIRESADDFRVHSSIYTDPNIFNLEMQELFESAWCYVAHESEIPNAGDFRTSAVGRVPVIVSRGDDGKVYVNVNACRHRGTVVCREEKGNTRFFVCPYHGWSYKRDGTLNNITDRDNFPKDWGKDIKGLVAADHVTNYRGMIFASFNPEVKSFESHMGPLKKYVDFWFDHALDGHVRVLKPWRALYQGNWKFQLENSTDGWHARYVHVSALKTLTEFGEYNPNVGWAGCTRGFTGGHGILERPRGDIPPELKSTFDNFQQDLRNKYGDEYAEEMFFRRHITIFPNIQLMEFKLRIIQPVAVDKTIIYEFPVELIGTSDEVNTAIRTRLFKEVSISSGSPVSGMVNADDVEIYARSQTGLTSGHMPWLRFGRGIHREQSERDYEWSGQDMDELPQRSLYREWLKQMS